VNAGSGHRAQGGQAGQGFLLGHEAAEGQAGQTGGTMLDLSM